MRTLNTAGENIWLWPESAHGDVSSILSQSLKGSPADSEVGLFWVGLGQQKDAARALTDWLRQQPDAMPVIALADVSRENVILFRRMASAVRLLSWAQAPQLLSKTLGEVFRSSAEEKQFRHRVADARLRNRHLEQMSEDLEKLVRERTHSAAVSKSEAETRVSSWRELLVFVKGLAAAQSLEDVLLLLRRELRRFHKVAEPILAYALGAGNLRLVYSRGGRVLERSGVRAWPQSVRLRRNELVDSQYLADEFGRPFNKVLAIPLGGRKAAPDTPAPTLFFEHQLGLAETEEFLHQISDRVQSVSVALDRLLLEFDLRSASYLWEHTFDGIDEPVAILDLDFNLLRSNKYFSADLADGKCFTRFNRSLEVCRGCPVPEVLLQPQVREGLVRRGEDSFAVHSYPIIVREGQRPTTVVNHYVNVTRQLQLQEQMIQTEKMVALGHLAGHIAHELNNPLTGIRSLAQFWLAQAHVPDQVKSDLREVESAAQRSQAIIANLIQFTGAGEKAAREARLDLNELVRKTLPLLKTAISHHLSDLQLAEGPAWVRAEPQLLQQVIFNLVKNACQAMPGKGELTLRTQASTHEGREGWGLWIRDTGVGMTPEVLNNLFAPFFTTKSEGEGTGLGLSLSAKIVERFGGSIEVQSKPGSGTEVCVWLPADEGKAS